jgi:putative addiction module component (TIGR02574 family)
MTTIYKEIRKKAITLLPPEERAQLAHELISSLDEKHISQTEEEWDREISRRVDEIKSGKVIGRPAVNVLSEIRAHYL